MTASHVNVTVTFVNIILFAIPALGLRLSSCAVCTKTGCLQKIIISSLLCTLLWGALEQTDSCQYLDVVHGQCRRRFLPLVPSNFPQV